MYLATDEHRYTQIFSCELQEDLLTQIGLATKPHERARKALRSFIPRNLPAPLFRHIQPCGCLDFSWRKISACSVYGQYAAESANLSPYNIKLSHAGSPEENQGYQTLTHRTGLTFLLTFFVKKKSMNGS